MGDELSDFKLPARSGVFDTPHLSICLSLGGAAVNVNICLRLGGNIRTLIEVPLRVSWVQGQEECDTFLNLSHKLRNAPPFFPIESIKDVQIGI